MPDFTAIANQFGWGIAFLVALGLAVWRLGRWLGEHVILPLTERHIKFLDKMEKVLGSLGQDVREIKADLGEVREKTNNHGQQIADLHTLVQTQRMTKD